MKRIVTLVAILLLAVATGCASKTAHPVETDRVEMPKSYRFDPLEIAVTPGTTVTFHNGDNFSHSVKFDQDVAKELVLAPGESGTVRFDQPGEYTYHCTFHAQQMKGKVIVRAK
jgi:plastocyanin